MADLSEHLGRGGELVVLLLIFVSLLSMHAPLRRRVFSLVHEAYRGVRNAVIYARLRSETIRDWTDALRLTVQDRRGFFLIVIALVIFSYIDSYVLNEAYIANYIYGRAPNWPDGISGLYWAIIYTLRTFTYVGYALFGWLAFQRAQGVDFQHAARFTPLRDVFLFFVFVTAVEFMTSGIAPIYVYGVSFLSQLSLNDWLILGKGILFSTAFAVVSAYLLFFIRRRARMADIAFAATVYILLTHLLQIYNMKMRVFYPDAFYIAFELSKHFLITVLWTIFFVAFCIVLGQSVRREQARAEA